MLDGVDFDQLDDSMKAAKRMAMYEAKYGEDSHTSTTGEMDAVLFGDWVSLENMENPNTSGMLTGESAVLLLINGFRACCATRPSRWILVTFR
jgi:hypothetical protein